MVPESDLPLADVDWDGPPPFHCYSNVPILLPQAGMVIAGDVISHHPCGVWTHWVDGRTRPHFKKKGACDGCRKKAPFRWKGYLAVWYSPLSCVALFEFSQESQKPWHHLLFGKREDVRGWRLLMSRRGKAHNAPLVMHLDPLNRPERTLPLPIVIPHALARVWQLQKYLSESGAEDEDKAWEDFDHALPTSDLGEDIRDPAIASNPPPPPRSRRGRGQKGGQSNG